MTVNVSPSPTAPIYTGKITAGKVLSNYGLITFSVNFPIGNYIVVQNQATTVNIGSVGFGVSAVGNPQYFYNTTGSTTATVNLNSPYVLTYNYRVSQLGFGTSSNFYVSATYGNGLFLASGYLTGVSQFPLLVGSTDGITWTTRNHGFGTTRGVVNAIAYSSTLTNKYIVGGQGVNSGLNLSYALSTSTDGITWTTRNPGFGTSAGTVTALAVGNGIYLAASAYTAGTPHSVSINTSTDGVTWTARLTNSALFGTSNPTIKTIAYGAGLTNQYIAGGFHDDGTGNQFPILASSTDAITWTTRSVAGYAGGGAISTISGINSIVFGISRYVGAVPGAFGLSSVGLITSTDGATWNTGVFNTVSQNFNTGGFTNVIYNSNGYTAWPYIYNQTSIQSSTDGVTWTTIPFTGGINYGFLTYGISATNPYVVVGTSNTGIYSSLNVMGDLQSDYYVRIEGPSPLTTII
jgi:hypothetical protein